MSAVLTPPQRPATWWCVVDNRMRPVFQGTLDQCVRRAGPTDRVVPK